MNPLRVATTVAQAIGWLVLAAGCVMISSQARAGVNPQPSTRAVALKRSGSPVAVTPAPKSLDECVAALRALMAADGKLRESGQWKYECSDSVSIVGTFVPNPRPPPVLGKATFRIDEAPTKNTDGSPLTNLAGYRIYYGTSAGALTQSVQVPASATSYVIDQLAPGTWYFAAKAFAATGPDSAMSSVVSKAIP